MRRWCELCFKDTVSRIQGARFADLEAEQTAAGRTGLAAAPVD